MSVESMELLSGHHMKTPEKGDGCSLVNVSGFKCDMEFGLTGKGLVEVIVEKQKEFWTAEYVSK